MIGRITIRDRAKSNAHPERSSWVLPLRRPGFKATQIPASPKENSAQVIVIYPKFELRITSKTRIKVSSVMSVIRAVTKMPILNISIGNWI